MTLLDTQTELDRYRDIILAAYEFKSGEEKGQLKPEQVTYSENFYRLCKEQVEKQYQEKSLEKLKKSLEYATSVYKATGDLKFLDYIKTKTGYDFDLFGNIYERMDKIIARKKIANHKERNEAITMIQLSRKTSKRQEIVPALRNLITEFNQAKGQNKSDLNVHSLKYLREMNSPDNKYCLSMYESVYLTDYPGTYITVQLENDTQYTFYAAKGVDLVINMHWNNNHCIVIETRKDYEKFIKTEQVQVPNGIINIEYIES